MKALKTVLMAPCCVCTGLQGCSLTNSAGFLPTCRNLHAEWQLSLTMNSGTRRMVVSE